MDKNTPKQRRNDLLGKKVVESLGRRNFEAYYCKIKKEALAKAL